MPSSGLLEGLTVFSENMGLVVGRTLVDPSDWKVPVLVSNFGQETVMVEPFSEIGMIAQVSAIQPVMNHPAHPSCDPSILPQHLQGLLDRTSGDLSDSQERLTREYITGVCGSVPRAGLCSDRPHGCCRTHHRYWKQLTHSLCSRRMSPQKIKQEEACVEEMLSGGQIEPSDSPCSAPVVLVTKKDGDDGQGRLPAAAHRRYS